MRSENIDTILRRPRSACRLGGGKRKYLKTKLRKQVYELVSDTNQLKTVYIVLKLHMQYGKV